MRLFSLNVFVLLAGLAVACCGCGNEVDLGPSGTASGKLTYNGQPLAEGTVVLFTHKTRGFSGVATTDAEGHFTLTHYRKSTGATPELPVGDYVVTIQPASPAGESGDPTEALSPDEAETAARQQKAAGVDFPPKYRQPHTSGITKAIDKGENTFNIDLK